MILLPNEAELFFKLYLPLLSFAYGKNIPARKKNYKKFRRARMILCGNASRIIDDFFVQNPVRLSQEELDIILS